MIIKNIIIFFHICTRTFFIFFCRYQSSFLSYSLKCCSYEEERKCCNYIYAQLRKVGKRRVYLSEKPEKFRNFSSWCIASPVKHIVHTEFSLKFLPPSISCVCRCTCMLYTVLISWACQRDSQPFFVAGKKLSETRHVVKEKKKERERRRNGKREYVYEKREEVEGWTYNSTRYYVHGFLLPAERYAFHFHSTNFLSRRPTMVR